jgi:hypothetical protein
MFIYAALNLFISVILDMYERPKVSDNFKVKTIGNYTTYMDTIDFTIFLEIRVVSQ